MRKHLHKRRLVCTLWLEKTRFYSRNTRNGSFSLIGSWKQLKHRKFISWGITKKHFAYIYLVCENTWLLVG